MILTLSILHTLWVPSESTNEADAIDSSPPLATGTTNDYIYRIEKQNATLHSDVTLGIASDFNLQVEFARTTFVTILWNSILKGILDSTSAAIQLRSVPDVLPWFTLGQLLLPPAISLSNIELKPIPQRNLM